MLIKDAGYNLRDIRGSESRTVRHEERTDFIARVRYYLPFLDDPEPHTVVEKTVEDGMGEEEVLRRLVYHDEIETIREEEQEDEMRKARRQHQNMGYK